MKEILIGSAGDLNDLKDAVTAGLALLEDKGTAVATRAFRKGDLNFLALSVETRDGGKTVEDIAFLKQLLAGALSENIVTRWEDALIRKIIRERYCYIGAGDQKSILQNVKKLLSAEGRGAEAGQEARYRETGQEDRCVETAQADRRLGAGQGNGCGKADRHQAGEPGRENGRETDREDGTEAGVEAYRIARQSRVAARIRSYLETADELVLEGFLIFRLKDYVEELEDMVDRAVDDFLMEREYREFIRLLRCFVEAQEPRLDEVHVLLNAKGTFRLVDGRLNSVGSDHLEDLVVEMMEKEVNYEDLLVSALISIVPNRIRIHCRSESRADENIETVMSVFGSRVSFCPGCDLCQQEPEAAPAKTEKK